MRTRWAGRRATGHRCAALPAIPCLALLPCPPSLMSASLALPVSFNSPPRPASLTTASPPFPLSQQPPSQTTNHQPDRPGDAQPGPPCAVARLLGGPAARPATGGQTTAKQPRHKHAAAARPAFSSCLELARQPSKQSPSCLLHAISPPPTPPVWLSRHCDALHRHVGRCLTAPELNL